MRRKEEAVGEIVSKLLTLVRPEYWLDKRVNVVNKVVQINGRVYTTSKPLLIAVGKSAVPMAKWFMDRMEFVRKIVVTPVNVDLDAEVIVAQHPYPGPGSLEAGRRVIEALETEDYDLVLFLISGGASALMEYSEMDLEELVELNSILVTSGLSIDEINTVRKHVSLLKGGQLAMKSKSKVVTLAVSDVPGDDPSVIGSGPTVPDSTTKEEALEILERLGLKKFSRYLRETPKSLPNSEFFLLYDAMDVLREGFRDWTILTSEVRGEARSLGEFLSSIANNVNVTGLKRVALAGEPEVRITGKSGKGGRNGEVCLSFLEHLRSDSLLVAVASDGIDGNSEYAGCFAYRGAGPTREEVVRALDEHDSYSVLEKYGLVIKTGYTFSNVNNFYFLLS